MRKNEDSKAWSYLEGANKSRNEDNILFITRNLKHVMGMQMARWSKTMLEWKPKGIRPRVLPPLKWKPLIDFVKSESDFRLGQLCGC